MTESFDALLTRVLQARSEDPLVRELARAANQARGEGVLLRCMLAELAAEYPTGAEVAAQPVATWPRLHERRLAIIRLLERTMWLTGPAVHVYAPAAPETPSTLSERDPYEDPCPPSGLDAAQLHLLEDEDDLGEHLK